MKKPVAFALLFTAAAALAAPFDRLDSDDGLVIERLSSKIEWNYNIGVLEGTNAKGEARRLAFVFDVVVSPILKGFIGLTPIIDFFADPGIHVLVLDLDKKRSYDLHGTATAWDSETFDASNDRMSLAREDSEGHGVVTKLRASGQGLKLALSIASTKPKARYGDNGWIDAGELGKTYYQSRTGRTLLPGEESSVTLGGERILLKQGQLWEDHQIIGGDASSSPSVAGSIRWNWFALALENRNELMVYRIEDAQSGKVYQSTAFLIRPDGSTPQLDGVTIRETHHIDSRGFEVPDAWSIQIPSVGLDLKLRHEIAAPWFDLPMGMTEGSILEGSCTAEGASKLGKVTMAWCEHFSTDFFKLVWR